MKKQIYRLTSTYDLRTYIKSLILKTLFNYIIIRFIFLYVKYWYDHSYKLIERFKLNWVCLKSLFGMTEFNYKLLCRNYFYVQCFKSSRSKNTWTSKLNPLTFQTLILKNLSNTSREKLHLNYFCFRMIKNLDLDHCTI